MLHEKTVASSEHAVICYPYTNTHTKKRLPDSLLAVCSIVEASQNMLNLSAYPGQRLTAAFPLAKALRSDQATTTTVK